MKRLLTYLSAIIIMMMVPIGMQADVTIYVLANSAPYVYAWDSNDKALTGVWGSEDQKMTTQETVDGVRLWKMTVTTSETTINLLFHDGPDSQTKTGDINSVADGDYLWYDGSTSGKKLSTISATTAVHGSFTGWSDASMTSSSTGFRYYDVTEAGSWGFKINGSWNTCTTTGNVLDSVYKLNSTSGNNQAVPSVFGTYSKVRIVLGYDGTNYFYQMQGITNSTPTPTISSVLLIGDINNWTGTARALTDNGNNEYSITISATDVRNKLNGGVFRFRFIQVMSDNAEYGIYPNTNATALTSGAAYNTDTYSTTETTTGSYKDYYWTVTPADNDVSYTFYFKNDGTPQVKYTVTTSGGGGTSTGYYLVGDLNAFGRAYNDVAWDGKNWGNYGAINKVLKFKDNGNGTYSLRIPAAHPAENENDWDKPSKETEDVSHQFVIAPENAFSGTEYSGDLYTVGDDNAWKTVWGLSLDWSKVLRPTSHNVLNNADANGNMAAGGGTTNWEAKMNGGSYTITINPTANTWTVTNDNLTHVMYVITKQDGYWRSSYLTDVTTGVDQAYNHEHGNSGELSEFPNESGSTVYVAHNWYENGSNKKFSTKEHLSIFGAWNDNGDLAPVTWIAAKSGATAKSIFPTAGKYSTAMDPTRGRTDGVDGGSQSQKIITNTNDPSTGNINGAKGDDALISPDATLSPASKTWDNYTVGTTKTLTVDMNSYATGYKYSYGADSTPSITGSSTTFGNLSYDGTDVKLGDDVVASNTNTVTFYIQGTDGTNNGTVHEYTYTFNVPVVSTIDFTPKGGLFINSAKITVTGGTAPYTYTVKASDGTVRSTGYFVLEDNDDEDNYRISTPGILTVTDANGNSATSTEAFDFTYSTSENYKNYNSNATGSKIIQTGGGQGALNVFINKNDDLGTLWLYAYNKTLDGEWKAEHGNPGDETTDEAKKAKQAQLDAVVRLTDAFPGNDMTNAPTITIDGIKYVHFTIPEGNLRSTDKVAIIVSQGTEDKQYWYTQTTDAGIEIERTEDPAFIYNIKNSPSGTPSSGAETAKGTNTLLPMNENGERTIFFTKPSGWTAPIYCHSWIPNSTGTEWKATNEKMTVYDEDNNIYTYTVPNEMTKLMFVDKNDNKTSEPDYNGGRIHYTWNGSTLSSTTATYAANLTELNTFLNTPPTTTVVTQKYPNGEDYWRAAPGDLSIKLDPTWGITGGLDDETSTRDWAGNVPKVVYTNQMPLTQTIQGLNAGKTYTVQAIVRGLGENEKTVTLTLEGAKKVTKTLNLRNGSGGSENSADLSRQGSEITRTGRVEYIEPLVYSSPGYKYKEDDNYYKNLGSGWAKVEATVKASQAGWLTISLTGDEWFDLSQVTLLEDANTTHGFRTTASATALSTGDSEETHTFDYRARDISRGWKKNNAYSFFDRGKNRNAVIFANERTVIAMNPDLLADVPQNEELKAVDRRHPFNVVGSDEDDSNIGTAKALYLTDMGYGTDPENPVDYKIGDSTWATYNSTNYRKSGYTFKPYLAFNAEDVILDRTPGVAEKKQTTIMLPFGITIEELKQYYGDAVQAWDYHNYNNTNRTITFTEETNALTANKPYILTGAYGILDSRGKGNGIKNVAAVVNTTHHTASDHSGFTGTYEYKLISRGDANETHYGYNPTTGKFQIAAKGGAALKPFRAYFTLPIPLDEQNAAPYFTVIFDDVSTGISTVEQAEVEDNNVYTISGMYVGKLGADKLHKGVYIVNGKKYVVK